MSYDSSSFSTGRDPQFGFDLQPATFFHSAPTDNSYPFITANLQVCTWLEPTRETRTRSWQQMHWLPDAGG